MTYSVDELRSMQNSGNYRGLLFALAAPDGFTRTEAMSRLAKFQKDAVRDAAVSHLKSDPDHTVRAQACFVLRGFPRCDRISQALRCALRDDSRHVRSKAALALAQLRARDALDDVLAMRDEGLEPDIEESVNLAIDILATPDKSETLIELADRKDVEGIGKLFDCMLKPDHDEIEAGLASQGRGRMLDVFRQWESSGRLTALEGSHCYAEAKREYAERLIEACGSCEPSHGDLL